MFETIVVGVLGLSNSYMIRSWRLYDHSICLDIDDIMVWMETKNGNFSVKSFYSLASRRVESLPYGTIWNSWVPVRASFFVWEAT